MSLILNGELDNWTRAQSRTVELELKEKQQQLIDALDYELSISFIFNNERNIAFRKSAFPKDGKSFEKIIPLTLFINKPPYTRFKNLLQTKKLIESHKKYGDTMLVENMESEVLLPLFDCNGNDMILIGCLYLGSSTYHELESYTLAEYMEINKIIGDIAKLCTLTFKSMEQRTNTMNMAYMFTEILNHKEGFLSNHSYNVANWSRNIAMELGLPPMELDKIYLAGLLHDIGKSMIDGEFLNKAGRLTDEEYEIIKKHPVYSAIILKYIVGDIYELKDIPKIVRHHHERYDGQGYPDGLKGDEVPFYSYILGISDAVDSMLSNRPYRKGISINSVIGQLYENKGTQFHPELVDIMMEKLVKAQKHLDITIEESINLSTLIINFKDKVHIFEGALIKYQGCYQFKPTDEIGELDLSKAINVELVVKNINNIYNYEAKIEEFYNNTFYLSSLKLIPTTNTFNLLWNLNGVLYLPDNNILDIEIIRIGGSSLVFSGFKESIHNIPEGKPIALDILFEEETLKITGNIIKSYNMGAYTYFNYAYTKIPDSKRDFIYRQLFKKQIELRQTVFQYK